MKEMIIYKMMNKYDRMVVRSIRKYEQKMWQITAASIACFVLFIRFYILLNAPLPSPVESMSSDDDEVEEKKTSGSRPYHCKKGGRSEFCDLEGDIRIDPFSPTVYYVVSSDTSTNTSTSANHSWSVLSSIKPYARNEDRYAMASVREWSVVMVPETHEDLPFCNEIHDAAGVIFSFGGYAGNHFHTFSDVLIPLFATSHPFKRQVELLVTDNQSWLIQKFKTIMQALSSYDVVDIDREQQAGKSHCFSRLILGLKGRQMIDFGINSSEYC